MVIFIPVQFFMGFTHTYAHPHTFQFIFNNRSLACVNSSNVKGKLKKKVVILRKPITVPFKGNQSDFFNFFQPYEDFGQGQSQTFNPGWAKEEHFLTLS